MEVSRSPQNGGLRIAAEWRSPGHRRMEVSRSPQDGGLQVAAKWRSSGRRRSADHCGKVEVFVAKEWRYSNRRWVEVFIGWRSSGYRGVKVLCRQRVEIFRSSQDGDLQIAIWWKSPGRNRMRVSRSPQNGGTQVAIARRYSSHQRIGNLQVATRWRSPVSFIQPETQARDSAFYKHSKPWFPSWKKVVGNQNSDCRRDLHEIQQPGEATKGAVTIYTEVADTSFSIIQCNLLC